jgi:site-specific DNA-cytosine methylase
MTPPLVLSIFPGADMLGMAFEQAGFCVVHGPDVIFGRDIREFHLPAGVFDGIIGGDPCQSHSTLARLVRAKGYEPKFPDMTPEYRRLVEEAKPRWFLRENVPLAPDLAPVGYGVSKLFLRNLWIAGEDGLGQEADRKRCFWFGTRGLVICRDLRTAHTEGQGTHGPDGCLDSTPVRLEPFISDALACLEQPRRLVALTAGTGFPVLKATAGMAVISGHGDESFLGRSAERAKAGFRVRAMAEPAVTNRHPGVFPTTDQAPTGWTIEAHQAVLSDSRAVPVAIGGSGKRKVTAAAHPTVTSSDGSGDARRRTKQVIAAYAVTGSNGGTPSQRDAGVRSSRMPISEMCRLQGLPEDFLEDAPFTADGKRQIIANGVPLPMGRAIAKAVKRAMGYDLAEASA